jgi:hypothetical protein
LLDVPSVHRVSHVLRELREECLERDLLEHVGHRLEDQALLDRKDLRDSVGQLLNGDVVVLRPSADTGDKRTRPAQIPGRS